MNFVKKFLLSVFAIITANMAMAQVTTSTLTGKITDDKQKGLANATVEAVHEPSGTRYRTLSQANGSYSIPGMRIGGPYTITITYVGKSPETYSDVYLQLATPMIINTAMKDGTAELKEVVVTSARSKTGKLISVDKKGTSTNIGRRTLETMPTLSRSLTDFTKLTPQAKGTSFAGMDDRFNNLTIDGSIFNNSFGLQSLPGSQTNSTPISLDAIEEIQVSLSPYSVKEAGFTGAGINAVTKSGTNTFHASAFYNQRNEGYTGKKANGADVIVADFDVKQFGFRFGGPIIKNKLFFFVNGEAERRSDPGVSFKANDNNGTTDANETRVLRSDLDALSAFLKSKFNYDPGVYEGYSLKTYSNKALAKLDWNINDVHKFSFRVNYLRSWRDVPVSNSGGFNGRRDNLFAMNYSNNNYKINNDIYSAIAEINSNFSNRMSNNMIFGFTANRDYRSSASSPFPLVDILNGGRNYISFGYEPFTPNNRLNTNTFQFSDNLTLYRKRHTYSTGFNIEAFKFFNSFTPTLYGQFAFKSLADFYTSANAFIANPNMATNPVQLQAYNLSYSAMPGGQLWSATTKAYQVGFYAQDEFSPFKNFNITYGFRMDIPFFGQTGLRNDSVAAYVFKDDLGNYLNLRTDRLPKAHPLFNPRIGFNWDVTGKKQTQVRGGIGVFSGRPAFVWISNQMGNTGVQSGSIAATNTTAYAFSTDIKRHIPSTITTPAPSYNIAVTDKDFKFPQIVRGNIAIDQQLPWNLVASAEFMYSKFINNINYINANLREATDVLKGADNRPKFGGSNALNRINQKISDATVMNNNSDGYTGNITFKLERPFRKNFSWMMAYNRGFAKDLISAGSIAFSSWSQNVSVRGNNHPDLAYSNNDQRHRFVGNMSYRFEWLKNKSLGTTFTLFFESRTQGRVSYLVSGDLNGDQISGNDLLYVPNHPNEIYFTPTTINGVTYTAQQQADAFWSFVEQDKYLRTRKGMYAERNGYLLNTVQRWDLSIAQDISHKFGGQKHTMQLRMDIFNIGNMLNDKNGVGDVINTNTPLTYTGVDANGYPLYRMTAVNNALNYGSTRKSTNISDVWQMQLGLRYSF